MNFLAPLFLAGALAVALPVVFHLIRRTTRERRVFSSLMFLRPTPPRLTRRNRLEHLLLLLLRCAAICLLAAGFARPFLKHALPETPSAEAPKRILLLVDTSASMRRTELWSQAQAKASAILQSAAPADRMALYIFDRQLTPLVTFDEWNSIAPAHRAALARSRLDGAKPGWAATRLDQAVLRAAELLAEAGQDELAGPRQVVLVSDFQEGSKFSGLQGQEWPKGVELRSERVMAKTSNAGLQLLTDSDEASTAAGKVRLRVSNAADATREQFQVGWAGSDGGFVTNATDIYVPAGQSRILMLPSPAATSRADRVVLRGDDEAFDNVVFHRPPDAVHRSVIFLGRDSVTNSRGPLYFVARALQGTPRQTIAVSARETSALMPGEADGATMFVVTDSITDSLAAVLRQQVQPGKTVLFAPSSAEAAATLGTLLEQSRIVAEEVVPGNYAMLGEIDFRHPLFAPFADSRFSDFTKIHFWKYRRLDAAAIPGAQIVARFDHGDAAMIDIPLGRGRVIVFASGWHPADSQLALSTKFVPLLCSVLELNGSLAPPAVTFSVGDTVPLPADWLPVANAATITAPDGAASNLAAGQTNFTQTTMPGIYQVNTGTTTRYFAVNIEAAESRTAPLPLDEFERLGVPVPKPANAPVAQSAAAKPLRQNAELESQQKLWRWFIAATLGVLLLETVVAGVSARRQSVKAEVAA